jgi:hypothetical protein
MTCGDMAGAIVIVGIAFAVASVSIAKIVWGERK